MEIYVDSAEQLCDLMCNNNLPKEKEGWFVFTFGQGQTYAGYLVKIYGTFSSTREKMMQKYGTEWAFQYTLEEWGEWLRTKPAYIPEEKVLEVIK